MDLHPPHHCRSTRRILLLLLWYHSTSAGWCWLGTFWRLAMATVHLNMRHTSNTRNYSSIFINSISLVHPKNHPLSSSQRSLVKKTSELGTIEASIAYLYWLYWFPEIIPSALSIGITSETMCETIRADGTGMWQDVASSRTVAEAGSGASL